MFFYKINATNIKLPFKQNIWLYKSRKNTLL